jgi:anhydro-N-acetylmuramic acid kinase
MNKLINQLVSISNKNSRKIIGLMSGTSLDGLDIALCEVEGSGKQTKVSLHKFETIPYDLAFKTEIRKVFSKRNVDLQDICLLNTWIANIHAEMINEVLKKWEISKNEIDLIASHGQTIFHAPKSLHQINKFANSTLQIGDADHIAIKTGIITVSDFRQKNIAAGGEGAPLAAYGDFLLFGNNHKDQVLLNIGGISNLTHIPASGDFADVLTTDIGPGNTLMDAWVNKYFDKISFDHEGLLAREGVVNFTLLECLSAHQFFSIEFPKTTGQEVFNVELVESILQESKLNHLSSLDVLATLNAFSANTIIAAIEIIMKDIKYFDIYVSGGGLKNKLLMEYLINHFDEKIIDSNHVGLNPDAKEAILFALLANETIAGNGEIFEKGSGNLPKVNMGKISAPF